MSRPPGTGDVRPAHLFTTPLQTAWPRGGPAGEACYWCYRLGHGKVLRHCDVCKHSYCGRRQCRAIHARFCTAYIPHWKEGTR